MTLWEREQFESQESELERKRATVCISDAGLLGATPSVSKLEIRWQGNRNNITAVIVRKKEHRYWTLADRVNHAKQSKTLRMTENLKRSGLLK